jgi:hypothetical protein
VSGGHIVASTLSGTVEGTGGLIFGHGGHSVRLTNFVFNTSARELTAVLAGERRAIFNLNLSLLTHATGSNGVLFGRDIELSLTAGAATTLNSLLYVSAFRAGEHFGTVTLTLAVRS